jgi:glyoxylase-like metal-dependent hydrolase (beta-lactamase superfamily II)
MKDSGTRDWTVKLQLQLVGRLRLLYIGAGHLFIPVHAPSGNITIAVGTDGIIMVDSEFAPLRDKIKAAIEKLSPLPIKYLIDTHYHGDHTGGNALFHKDGATIVAEDNIRVRLAAGNAPTG